MHNIKASHGDATPKCQGIPLDSVECADVEQEAHRTNEQAFENDELPYITEIADDVQNVRRSLPAYRTAAVQFSRRPPLVQAAKATIMEAISGPTDVEDAFGTFTQTHWALEVLQDTAAL